MVVGNGMVANKFANYEDENTLFFASGVSNSNETDLKAFMKEETLLQTNLQKDVTKTFVYFSSCDIENPQLSSKPYYRHKANMERLVSSYKGDYYIFRLPQVVGHGGNKNTLMNFLIDRIKNGISFEVWQGTEKNIIDIDDVYIIISHILNNKTSLNSVCNIINTRYISILELVAIIEQTLKKKAVYTTKDLNTGYYYNPTCMESVLKEFDLEFDNDYFKRLVLKYASVTKNTNC
ncbi:hypothetical protein KKA17_01555 [bacterium]|nr:hypothetical protein [bacterium]MBU1882834.1 hypothetical protein [bacterium]